MVVRADLVAKLRESNVTHPRQVMAVVLETTGDVSVLHSDEAGAQLDTRLLENVRGLPDPLDAPAGWDTAATS